jgi:phage recombination protein Bet
MSSNIAKLNQKQNLTGKFANRFGVDEGEVMSILKSTAFKQRDGSPPVTDAQMSALMIVAEQYGLNPFVKEIYAYPDKNNGIVPVVGVDGWNRIMNEHPMMDGIEFKYSDELVTHKNKNCHVWIEAIITRKDRSKPIVVREYFDEVMRSVNFATPWDSHPKRMHRHKTEIQAARIAFGFAGIYDEDEAERIIEKDITPQPEYVELKQTPYLSDANFTAKEEAWKKIYFKGVKAGNSIDEFYNWIEQKGEKLTDAQKEEIALWKEANVIEGEAKTIDPFVEDMKAAESDSK